MFLLLGTMEVKRISSEGDISIVQQSFSPALCTVYFVSVRVAIDRIERVFCIWRFLFLVQEG